MIEYTLPPGLVESTYADGAKWYSYHGKSIRSISRILNRIYPLPPDLPAYYLERGKAVHSATVLIDEGRLDWDALDEKLKPFADAYQSFLDTSKVVVEASELTVVHPSYKYGARLDRIYTLPGGGKPIVVDIKCGLGKEPRYWYQIALCAMAFNEAEAPYFDLAILNLDNTGKPHFTFADDPATLIEGARKILKDDLDFLEGSA